MFIGPALRQLIVNLMQPGHGEKAGIERKILEIAKAMLPVMNKLFHCDLDLYALQFSPCLWGKWVAAITYLGSPDSTEYAMKLERLICGTRRGRDKARIYQLESKFIKELWNGLGKANLLDEFRGASTAGKKRAFDGLYWSLGPQRPDILAVMDNGHTFCKCRKSQH